MNFSLSRNSLQKALLSFAFLGVLQPIAGSSSLAARMYDYTSNIRPITWFGLGTATLLAGTIMRYGYKWLRAKKSQPLVVEKPDIPVIFPKINKLPVKKVHKKQRVHKLVQTIQNLRIENRELRKQNSIFTKFYQEYLKIKADSISRNQIKDAVKRINDERFSE